MKRSPRPARSRPETPPEASLQETDRRRTERRIELVEAAVRVIRREGPGASMDQFAAEAGITKPILYRHFGDRSGLYAAITAYAFEHLGAGLREALADLERPPRQVVAATIDSYLAFIEREPEMYHFLTLAALPDHPGAKSEVFGFLDQIAREIAVVLGETLRASGEDSGPTEAWAHGIVGMVFAAAGWWLERRMMPRARLCAYLTDLVCDGLPGAAAEDRTVTEILAAAPTGPNSTRATAAAGAPPTSLSLLAESEPRPPAPARGDVASTSHPAGTAARRRAASGARTTRRHLP